MMNSSASINEAESQHPHHHLEGGIKEDQEHQWNVVAEESNFSHRSTSKPPHMMNGGGSKNHSQHKHATDFISWSVGQAMNSFDVADFTKAFQTVTLLNLISSCLVSFNRVVYLDLVSTLAIFWFNLDPDTRWRESSYLYPITGITVSRLFDGVWCWYRFFGLKYPESSALVNSAKLFTLVDFFMKVLMLLFLLKARQDHKHRSKFYRR